MSVYDLIDYYIENYVKEIEHGTDGFARAGMLQGLYWICRFYGITDEDLGEERFRKIQGR